MTEHDDLFKEADEIATRAGGRLQSLRNVWIAIGVLALLVGGALYFGLTRTDHLVETATQAEGTANEAQARTQRIVKYLRVGRGIPGLLVRLVSRACTAIAGRKGHLVTREQMEPLVREVKAALADIREIKERLGLPATRDPLGLRATEETKDRPEIKDQLARPAPQVPLVPPVLLGPKAPPAP